MRKTKVLRFTVLILICASLALSHFSFLSFNLGFGFSRASAYDPDIYVPVPNELITDGKFENSGSSLLASPSAFTGSAIGDSTDSNTVKGIIDLRPTSFLDNYKNTYRLAKKDEHDHSGVDYYDPTGKISEDRRFPTIKERDHTNVLMINNTEASAYQYSSGNLTIAPNHYYEISAQVLTADFSTIPNTVSSFNRGAFLRLTGDINVSTEAINTNYTWQKYRFIVKGHSFKSSTVTLNLMLGDDSRPTDDQPFNAYLPTKGFAFFFDVQALEISYDEYMVYYNSPAVNFEGNKQNIFCAPSSAHEIPFTNGDFEQPLPSGWTKENSSNANTSVVNLNNFDDIYQANRANPEYIKTHPHAVMGSINSLMISSRPNIRNVYGSMTSNAFTVNRHNYYRLSFWVNDTDIISGSAYAKIVSDENNEELDVENSSFSFIDESSWHRKWKQGVFYIQGSIFSERSIRLELGAGKPDAPFSGAVYFDNVVLEQITASEHSANSSSGTAVSFEGVSGSPSVGNGFFNVSGSFEEYKYPLPVQDWTHNYSEGFENKVRGGIVPTDSAHYEANKESYGNIPNPSGALASSINNMLLLWNKEPAAQKFTSPAISLTADSYQIITIRLSTDNMPSNKGAKLLFYNSSTTLGRIENIDTEGRFYDYSFKVKSSSFTETINVDIILGEEGSNDKNLVSGYLWVDQITLSTLTEDDYNLALVRTVKFEFGDERFEHNSDSGSPLLTSDTMALVAGKDVTNMNTVVSGVVDLDSPSADAVIPGLDKLKEGRSSRYGLLLHSLEPTAFGYQMKLPIQYNSAAFVKVSVRMKTEGFKPGEGARISLDANHAFLNANSQFPTVVNESMMSDFVPADFAYRNDPDYSFVANSDLEFEGLEVMQYKGAYIYKPEIDLAGYYNGWMDYSFYISTGDSRASDTLSIWLGNDDYFKNHRAGTVLVDQITINSITEDEYNEINTLMSEEDTLKPDYIMRVTATVSETPEAETPETETEAEEQDLNESLGEVDTRWWMLPSLTFAVVLVFAIIMVAFRKLAPRFATVQLRKKRVATYDRERPILKADKVKAERIKRALKDIDDEESTGQKAGYTAFDEDDDYDDEDDDLLDDEDDDLLDDEDDDLLDDEGETEEQAEDADSVDQADKDIDDEDDDEDDEDKETILSDDEPIRKPKPKTTKPKKPEIKKPEKPSIKTDINNFDTFED